MVSLFSFGVVWWWLVFIFKLKSEVSRLFIVQFCKVLTINVINYIFLETLMERIVLYTNVHEEDALKISRV